MHSNSTTPDDANRTAQELVRLFGIRHGRRQRPSGDYAGPKLRLSVEDVASHLDGKHTYGFFLVNEAHEASGICFDIDADFDHRREVLADLLYEIGGNALIEATVWTTGSSSERGKCLIALSSGIPQGVATRFAREVLDRAKRISEFHGKEHVDLRPTLGDGGLVRIGGRNRRPNRKAETVDTFVDPFGDYQFSLQAVVPYDSDKIAHLLKVAAPASVATTQIISLPTRDGARPSWVTKLLSTPLTRENPGGTRYIVRQVLYPLARYFVQSFSDQRDVALEKWRRALSDLMDLSPDLNDQPSKGTSDKRNPLRRELQTLHIFETCWAKKWLWQPRSFDGLSELRADKRQTAVRTYEALAAIVRKNGLRPYRFAVTYRRLQDVASLGSVEQARRGLKYLERHEYVVVFDRGGSLGRRPTQIGLVTYGDTIDEVRARGLKLTVTVRPTAYEKALAKTGLTEDELRSSGQCLEWFEATQEGRGWAGVMNATRSYRLRPIRSPS